MREMQTKGANDVSNYDGRRPEPPYKTCCETATEDMESELELLRVRVAELEQNQRMTPERARDVLGKMKLCHFTASLLETNWEKGGKALDIASEPGNKCIDLEGSASAEELEAIAAWIRDPKAVKGE